MTRTRVVPLLAASLLTAGLVTTSPATAGPTPGPGANPSASMTGHAATASAAVRTPRLRVRRLRGGLDIPWDVQPLGGGRLLVTERDRKRLSVVHRGKRRTVRFPRRTVWVSGETGLMSLAVAPDFAESRRFYVCHGARSARGNDVRVVSYRLSRNHRRARDRQVLLRGIPATSGRHGGCRLLLDREDGALYVGTGDAAVGTHPRDLRSLGGKVLRLDPATGDPWPKNPFITSPHPRTRYVLTYGHRNVQGLAKGFGAVWSIEHGSHRDDELNLLVAGGDYGWHPVPGYDESVPMTDHSLPGTQVEARWSSGTPTLATSGAAWVPQQRRWGSWGGTLAVATLKASRVLFLTFDPDSLTPERIRAPRALRRYGRLRSITATPGGSLLVTTSNGDGKDAILSVRPRGRR